MTSTTRTWCVLLAALAGVAGSATAGCSDRSLYLDAGVGAGGAAGRPAPTRDVDVLFMIDNSSAMFEAQQALTWNFPLFVGALETLPDGLPNLHIAVVSSDMGAGAGIIRCDGPGDDGVLQSRPRPPCTDSTLGSATFIANDNGVPNYQGDLREVFSCIANLGSGGCGFESPLAAISRALGAGAPAPVENAGFLRDDAHLAIVILANEDDCSATLGAASPLFDVSPNGLAAPLGPVISFRCNEFGHVCAEGTPSRRAPNNSTNDVVTYTDCRSNEDSAHLQSVASFVDRIRRLKTHPDERILVASIVGVPRGNPNGPIPYVVRWVPAAVPDTGPWPILTTACAGPNGRNLFGDPAIRLAEFTRHFGANGSLYSVCESDYASTLLDIAQRIGERLAR